MTETLSYKRLTLRVTLLFALSVLVGLVFTTAANASIMVPESSVFNVDSEELLDKIEQQSAASGSAGASVPATSQQETPRGPGGNGPGENDDLDRQLAAMAAQAEGSTSGTSSSTSSTNGGNSGASMLATTAAILPNSTQTERYAFEQSLFLPDAPGNQLLRPPQST